MPAVSALTIDTSPLEEARAEVEVMSAAIASDVNIPGRVTMDTREINEATAAARQLVDALDSAQVKIDRLGAATRAAAERRQADLARELDRSRQTNLQDRPYR